MEHRAWRRTHSTAAVARSERGRVRLGTASRARGTPAPHGCARSARSKKRRTGHTRGAKSGARPGGKAMSMVRQRAGEMPSHGGGGGSSGGAGGRGGLPPLPDKGPSARAGGGSRPPGRRFRATLTKEQAALIYTLRPPDKDDPNPNKLAGNSQLLSKQFGVSPKAVRDVWNRRTWAHATKDAHTSMPTDLEQLENNMGGDKAQPGGSKAPQDQASGRHAGMSNFRSPGRPVGSKDSKPRRRRSNVKAAVNGLPGSRGPCRCVRVRVCPVFLRAHAYSRWPSPGA